MLKTYFEKKIIFDNRVVLSSPLGIKIGKELSKKDHSTIPYCIFVLSLRAKRHVVTRTEIVKITNIKIRKTSDKLC
jgi:hypothetical protein